jgi:hypothetical protein
MKWGNRHLQLSKQAKFDPLADFIGGFQCYKNNKKYGLIYKNYN